MSGGLADPPAPGAARAAVERCLARIERLDPAFRAMATTTAERARQEADTCDRAAAEGRWLGLLHGMPIALKDNIETAGVRTTSGAAYLADHIPNRDAPVVGRLKAQGAVLIGKANMQELAFGVVSTNPVIGQCRNPWNPDHIPGGSSGGSGATVAAEMAHGSLGTDTGGSVRIPASMTGIAGLRPTHGRISIRGITPVSVAHDTVGPMARTVADVARLFAALAAYDPLDPVSRDLPLENFLPRLDDGIEGVRVGLARNFYFEGVDGAVEAAVRAAARTLEALGARLTDITLPGAETAQRWTTVMAYADACAYHKDRLDAGPGALSESGLRAHDHGPRLQRGGLCRGDARTRGVAAGARSGLRERGPPARADHAPAGAAHRRRPQPPPRHPGCDALHLWRRARVDSRPLRAVRLLLRRPCRSA